MPAAGDTKNEDADSAAGIEQMYKIYEKLNIAEDKTILEPEFRELLKAVKRSNNEKRLASQFITRFMDSFPLLYNNAIDSLLDLCEDDDFTIRKQVVRDLVTVCKKITTFVPKIADVFAQLMQTSDSNELSGLQGGIKSLFHIDAQATLVGLFSQIANGDPIIRERVIKCLSSKLKELSPEIVNLDFEKSLLAETKRIASELPHDDFRALLDIIGETKYLKTVTGHQAVVDLIAEMINFDKEFDASDVEGCNRLLICTKLALPYFSTQVSSASFAKYFCTNVLPNLADVLLLEEGETLHLETLKVMAELVFHVKQIDGPTALKCLEIIYQKLIELIPLPAENETDEHNPEFEFSTIECLLFVFHKLGSEQQEFLTSDQDKLKEIRLHLQYLARSSQGFMKKLREDLATKKGPELKTDEIRIKMTTNINSVVRDLFHNPPIYKTVVGLSWKPLAKSSDRTEKRKIDSPSPAMAGARITKQPRLSGDRDRGIYQPPSGKFSNRAGTYNDYSSIRQRGARKGYQGGGGRGRQRVYQGFRFN